MATSTISNTITDLNGTALEGVTVIVRLMPGPGFRISGATEVARMETTTTNASGVWSLALERNSNISPSGTWYEAEEQIPEVHGGARIWAFQVGASNASLYASLVTPSSATGLANYITQDSGDARYLRSFDGNFGYIDVTEAPYNATGDGVTDDLAAINAASAALATTGGTLFFPPGTYRVSGRINTPDGVGVTHAQYEIRGYGATIKPHGSYAGVLMGNAVPANVSAATALAARTVTVRGLRFEGTSTTGEVGLRIYGGYGNTVEHCAFVNLEYGCDLIFNLMPKVSNCFGSGNISGSLLLRSGTGLITGATGSNSGTNAAHVDGFRDYASSGQYAQVFLSEADGAIITNLITEGFNPQHAVFFDGNSNTTVKSFAILGWHSENVPSTAGLWVQNQTGGVLTVDRLFAQQDHVLIDTTGCGSSMTMVVRNLAYGIGQFRGDATGNAWSFEGHVGFADPRANACWVGPPAPDVSWAIRQSTSGEIGSGNGVTIDAKIIYLKASQTIILGDDVTVEDGEHIALGTSTGTKIGTATGQKLGFHNATPVAQRAGAAQAAVATTGATNSSPYGFATAAQADALVTLVNELRAALVEKGIIKGSA